MPKFIRIGGCQARGEPGEGGRRGTGGCGRGKEIKRWGGRSFFQQGDPSVDTTTSNLSISAKPIAGSPLSWACCLATHPWSVHVCACVHAICAAGGISMETTPMCYSTRVDAQVHTTLHQWSENSRVISLSLLV